MRRSLTVRVATLVFVVFTTTAPAFAAPRRDDSPVGFERVFSKIVKIVRTLIPMDISNDIGPPRP